MQFRKFAYAGVIALALGAFASNEDIRTDVYNAAIENKDRVVDYFQPKEKPWIKIDAATTADLIKQVKACPSGALSYYMNDESDKTAEVLETNVEVRENGPLLVYGTLKITHKDGSQETKNKTTAFCRCGASHNKPYCDGTHVKNDFMG